MCGGSFLSGRGGWENQSEEAASQEAWTPGPRGGAMAQGQPSVHQDSGGGRKDLSGLGCELVKTALSPLS